MEPRVDADREEGPSRAVSDDSEPLLILINIHGDFIHSSTKVKVTPTLTAGSVCSMVADKNGLSCESSNFFTLVAVYTNHNRPKPLSHRPLHLIRTLKASDIILSVIKDKEAKTPATREDMYTTKWYFKDIRTPPLSFDGDISGDLSSEDEEDVPVNYLSYLRQADEKGKTGYLWKRSVHDPNLWRRRLCLITDFHMLCIHAHKGVYRATRIKLHGPIFLQDDLLPLDYPLGFGLKEYDRNFFFRAVDEEEQTSWTTELIEYCKNEEDNLQIHMADVLISLEESERNSRCSDSFKALLSTRLLSWLAEEIDDRSEGQRDNGENMWSIHSFHSYHPLCGKAIGFIVAVNEEYKGLFRKFVRPSAAAFWDCAVEIYKRYIMPQIMSRDRSERKQSLCYAELQIPAEFISDGPLKFYNPSYLSGSHESAAEVQKIFAQNVRWKSKEEVEEETTLKSSIISFKEKPAPEEAEVPAGWFSGWMAPRPVDVAVTNSDLDRDAHGSSTPELRSGKSSRYFSKRYSCMLSPLTTDAGGIFVSDYVLLKGHDSDRPDINLFDCLVDDVTRWLNSEEAKIH